MSYYPISTVANVVVTLQEGSVALEDFGALCLFTEDDSIAYGAAVEFSSVEDFDAVFTTASPVKDYGDIFFAQQPTPLKIYVYRVNGATTSWAQAVEDCYNSFPTTKFYAVGFDSLDLSTEDYTEIGEVVQQLQLLWVQAVLSTSAVSITTALKALNYDRVAIISKDDETATQRIDAAWYGTCLTRDDEQSGNVIWSNKELTGVSATSQTNSQIDTLLAAYVNVYIPFNDDMDLTRNGWTCATGIFYIDQVVLIDYIRVTCTEAIANFVANKNLGYTDQTMGLVKSVVLNTLLQAKSLGFLDSGSVPTVTCPSVSTMTPEQKQSRVAPTITATCTEAGGINTFNVNIPVGV
jgi:hypothetical protein